MFDFRDFINLLKFYPVIQPFPLHISQHTLDIFTENPKRLLSFYEQCTDEKNREKLKVITSASTASGKQLHEIWKPTGFDV